MAQEIDSRFISILPSFANFGKKLNAELGGQAKQAGTQFGKDFSKSVTASTAGVEAATKRAARAVQQAENDVKRAKQDSVEATRRVKIEETKLAEARQSGKAKASQVLTIEDRLEKAKRRERESSAAATVASRKHEQALEDQKSDLAQAAQAADRAGNAFQGLGRDVKAAATDAGKPGTFKQIAVEAEKSGKDSSGRFSRAFKSGTKRGIGAVGSTLKAGLLGAVGAAALAGGAAIQKGFSRLTAIENAEAKLTGLGHATKSVKAIMDDALKSVKGTAFGLDEAASVAASTVAAGVKPGKELQRILSLVGDAATIAGTDMSEMGAIFNKVASSNKVQADIFNQLHDQGIPIVQMLAKSMGKTTAQIMEMSKEGTITFADFSKAMEEGLGGAALKSGDTTIGAFKNMQAALGRTGASLMRGLFPELKGGFSSITEGLDAMGPAAEEFGAKLGQGIAGVRDLLIKGDYTGNLSKSLGIEEDSAAVAVILGLRDGVLGLRSAMDGFAVDGESAKTLIEGLSESAKPLRDAFEDIRPQLESFGGFLINLGKTVGPIVAAVFGKITEVISRVAPMISSFLGHVMRFVGAVLPVIQQVIGTIVSAVQENLPQIMAIFDDLGTILSEVFTVAGQAVETWTNRFKAIWTVLGPIVLPILKALISGIIAALGGLVQSVKGIIQVIAGIFTGDFTRVKEGLANIFGGIVNALLGSMRALTQLLIGALAGIHQHFVGWATGLGTMLGNWMRGLAGRFGGWLNGIAGAIARWITGTKQAVTNWAGTVRATFNNFMAGVYARISSGFSLIRTKISDTMWAIRSTISNVGESIKSTFRGIVDGAGRIWDGLKAKAAAPIRFVIDTVFNNGLRKAYNSLASTFKIGQLPEVKAGFARGGILPGQSSWRGGDTHLRPMREGEGVYVSEAMRDPVERARLFAINAAAMAGRSLDSVRARFGEGFAKGGVVQPVPGRGNRHSGYGWATWAGDFPVPMGTPIKAWKDGVIAAVKYLTTSYGQHVRINHTDGTSSLYAHMSKIIASTVGQVVKAGQTIGLVGSTGNSSGPHLHFETMGGPYNGGGSAASGFDPLGMLTSSFAGPLTKLKGLGDSPIAELAKGFPAKVVELAKDKIKSVAASVMDVAGSAIDAAGIAARYSPLIIKHLIRNGMPLSLTDNMLRQIKSESGGNPNAVQQVRDVNWPNNKAVGLLQIIPGTFATYRDPSLPNDRTNAESSIAASIRYIKARYGSRAESVIGHGHGYAGGTTNASRGLHWVGEQGPELMSFRGGETVIPTRQSFEIAGLAQQMQGAGREVVAGFILGVNGGSDQVAAAARYLAATTTDAAKAELGIASPSKVFTQVGRWVGEGLAKGVKGTTKQIESTMKTLRTNMEKVWSQKNSASKKGAVAYWTKEVKRLKTLAKKNKSYAGQLKAAETNLGKARKGDTYAGVAAKWDGFNKRVSKINSGLKKNADNRTKITDQLKAAQARLSDAVKLRDDFAYGVWKGASESASVTSQSGDTWADFYGSLKGKLSGWKSFTTDMAQLRKLGLGNRAYEELVNAGPEQGGKIAKMLLGAGKGGIKEVNALQAQISRAGSVFGNQAAGVLYQPGVDAANGLIKGLQSKQKELDKIGTSLAQSLVKAVRKELKIKSPSRVMFDQGAYTGEGMALGMESMEARVAAAGAGLASAAVPGRPISTVDHAVSISGGQEFHIYIGDKEVTDLVRVEYDRRDKQAGRQVAMTGIGGGL